MRYVSARVDEYKRDEAYRIFVTESLRLAPQQKYISKSLTDFIEPKVESKKTCEEIVTDVMQKAGLRFE